MEQQTPDLAALARAVESVGGQTALADALGIEKNNVWMWLNRGRRVPAEHCPAIEAATGGSVRCEELRADVNWSVLRGSKTKKPATQGEGA